MSSEVEGRDAHIPAVLRAVNQALVEAEDRPTLEAAVVEILAESDPYVFAWIGEHDATRDRVVPRASAGAAEGYLDSIEIPVGAPEGEPGPTAAALRTGEVQVRQDILGDPAYERWREQARAQGFEASAAVPIADAGETYGVLNVYAPSADAFDGAERELLEELGSTIGNALGGLAAREALARQSRRFERLAERIDEGFYEVDGDWTLTYWNERMAERTGTPARDVVGETLWETFPVLEESEVAESYREAMATGEPRSLETYLEAPYDYWAEIDLYPGEDGMSVFSRDVTDRRRRERQLEALIENTVNPIYIKDLEGRYELMNDAAAELFGLDRTEAVGRTDEELFDEESAAEIRSVDRDIVASGRPDTRETARYIDGEKHFFLDNKFPYRDEADEIVGVMGVSHEITERESQRAELAETNQILEAIITASPDAVVMVDGDGAVTMWNEAAESLFGWTREEVLGAQTPFVPEEKEDEFQQLIAQLDEGEPARGFETVRRTKAGDHIEVSISSARVDVDGDLVGYMATIEDISERTAYRRRLEDQNRRLEVLNRLVRHDIGNDLQAIQGYAEMVADAAEDETVAEHAAVVLSSADHALELTRTVRDLMETVLGEEDGTEPVALARELDRELDDVQSAHSGVVVERAGPLPRVVVAADDMLGSVFRNVLTNAVRHTDAEPVCIDVAATAGEDTVTVRIADNGPGIPDDRKEAVFGQGERGVDSPGTGIGLHLVDVLVDGYGGDVWVEDAEPTGTAVHIELPIADASPPQSR